MKRDTFAVTKMIFIGLRHNYIDALVQNTKLRALQAMENQDTPCLMTQHNARFQNRVGYL